MPPALLTTKLVVPPPRPNRVLRPALRARLDEGLRLGRRLTLVSAPAGAGKTTLLSDWVAASGRPVAWLSLDEGDNDPTLFFSYLLAALGRVDARLGANLFELLHSPQAPALESLATALINDLARVGRSTILVLDDYHAVTRVAVHDLVAFLLEHAPSSLHLAIGTREDPPLPLPRLRARGQATELRGRDLRFTPAEAADFLTGTMGLTLPADAVAALEARTEGWVAGLQLAALALQSGRGGADDLVRAFAGDDRYIMDYLIAEVVERQPEDVRAFLRSTAVLDRLSGPLCDAVTGRDDGQRMLERLDAANLFVLPLDNRREWYRYHLLFAEFQRMALSREERAGAHRRAARWYESHGMTAPAVGHELAHAALTGRPDDAERLVAAAAEGMVQSGHIETVAGWLAALPDERVRANVDLALVSAWIAAVKGGMAEAEARVEEAEAHVGAPGDDPVRWGKLLTLRAFIALMGRREYGEAAALAQRALDALGDADPRARLIALWVLAESHERTSPAPVAIRAFREASRAGRELGSHVFAATAEMSLAGALNAHGRRHEALVVCAEAISRYVDAGGDPLPLAGMLFSHLGVLHYEANELEQALACHERGRRLNARLGVEGYDAVAEGLAAPTLYALGRRDEALDALERAHKAAGRRVLGEAEIYLAQRASMWINLGDLASARRWAEAAHVSLDEELRYLALERHVAFGRLLLAEGRADDARRWAERLLAFTERMGLGRWLITSHLLLALAVDRHEAGAARAHLLAALERAAPEEYVRAFLDEDARLIAMLPGVRAAAPAFVDALLAHAGIPAGRVGGRPGLGAQPLIEPLSERELEVLALIAEGLTNAEIGRRLFIATGTVKRHVNTIYGKLDVHGRIEAIARARDLHLIE